MESVRSLGIRFTETYRSNDDVRDRIRIAVRRWTAIFQISTLLLAHLTWNANRCTAIGDASVELVDARRFVTASQTTLVAFAVDIDVCLVTRLESCDRLIDGSTDRHEKEVRRRSSARLMKLTRYRSARASSLWRSLCDTQRRSSRPESASGSCSLARRTLRQCGSASTATSTVGRRHRCPRMDRLGTPTVLA